MPLVISSIYLMDAALDNLSRVIASNKILGQDPAYSKYKNTLEEAITRLTDHNFRLAHN
jgi:hypothetical protein